MFSTLAMPEPSTAFSRSPNQGLFSPEQIQRLMRIEFDRAQRYRYPIVFILVAVDRLSQLQDLYGYEVKAQILQSLTGLMKHATRTSDSLGCLIDDKLLMIVPHTPADGAVVLAKRLQEGARALVFEADDREVRITVSLGGAHNQRRGDYDFKTMLEVAEGGLQVALASGGDRYVHSDLYDFFQKKHEREAAEARASQPAVTQAPLPAPSPAPGGVVLDDQVSRVLEAKIQQLLGLGPDDAEILAKIQQTVIAEAIREMRGQVEQEITGSAEEHRREVDLLERRIAKLTNTLGLTEEELQRVLRTKSVDPGVASRFQSVQGLSGSEVQAELKRELMAKIFEANLELRKKFTSGS